MSTQLPLGQLFNKTQRAGTPPVALQQTSVKCLEKAAARHHSRANRTWVYLLNSILTSKQTIIQPACIQPVSLAAPSSLTRASVWILKIFNRVKRSQIFESSKATSSKSICWMWFFSWEGGRIRRWGKRQITEQIVRMKNFYKQQALGDSSSRNLLKVPKYKVAE